MTTTIKELQTLITDWADETMPHRTAENAFRKLLEEEIKEMAENPYDASEFADAIIILFDLAYLTGIDIAQAVKMKMKINKRRTWSVQENGLFKHVKGAENGHNAKPNKK